MHLGREAVGARAIPVYAMPRMASFLRENGPWDQLIRLANIEIEPLAGNEPVELAMGLRVTPLPVPHREEYSETVGFVVEGPNASLLFLPDIDKWERWDRRLEDVLATVDRAYVDGTFFENGEIPGRDMADIPHPFIEETLARVAELPAQERAKVRFLHLNHTNPALDLEGEAVRRIRAAGCDVAVEGERFGL
jgi:pyrroloquinoline quinone biosynthesis protein B